MIYDKDNGYDIYMPKLKSQKLVLDSVICHLEERLGLKRDPDWYSPDEETGTDPKMCIDLVGSIGSQLYAFEHTLIEPFQKQIEHSHYAIGLFEPLASMVDDQLPKDSRFYLCYPVYGPKRVKNQKSAQEALAKWILLNASDLPYGEVYRLGQPKRETPNGVPFEVSLARMKRGNFSSGLCIRTCAPSDLEELRTERLRKVCKKKYAKLAAWKKNHGARTILVLENQDMQETNASAVLKALEKAEVDYCGVKPDEVYKVNVYCQADWEIVCFRQDNRSWIEMGGEILPVTRKE